MFDITKYPARVRDLLENWTPSSTLDPQFKATLVATLRSGNYKKGCATLRTTTNECCCLGVAGDILVQQGKAMWLPPDIKTGYRLAVKGDASDCSHGYLIDDLRPLVGLTRNDMYKLAEVNDATSTFEVVADMIEAMPTE